MNVIQALRPTALPAILFVLWWPLFMWLPRRFAREFFALTGLLTVTLVAGPLLAIGLAAAILLAYPIVEGIARLKTGRRPVLVLFLLLLHAGYWGTFYLPLPRAFAMADLRPADQSAAFVLFSGIGVSFIRLLSFVWDRLRPGAAAVPFRDYLAYMLFFPQFRHGPVERCQPFAAQLTHARDAWQPRDAGVGLLRIFIAFSTLLLMLGAAHVAAQHMSFPINNVSLDAVTHPEQLSALETILLIHAPLLLLYILESSFARLQLGVSRVFGVRGTENFRYPLLARSPREIWHRWNISVSTWLRDYVYFPLGGGRHHKYRNIILTFAYCGVLHALQWRCLAWGLWTGGTLALLLWVSEKLKRPADQPPRPRHPALRAILAALAWLATYEWMCIGVTIILDPDTCGARLLVRYLGILTGGLIAWPAS